MTTKCNIEAFIISLMLFGGQSKKRLVKLLITNILISNQNCDYILLKFVIKMTEFKCSIVGKKFYFLWSTNKYVKSTTLSNFKLFKNVETVFTAISNLCRQTRAVDICADDVCWAVLSEEFN